MENSNLDLAADRRDRDITSTDDGVGDLRHDERLSADTVERGTRTDSGGPVTRHEPGVSSIPIDSARSATVAAPSDHYISLAQQLRVNCHSAPPMAVGITSCQRGEGVSTVAINLALAGLRVVGQPALLVDTNRRWTGGERFLHMPGACGLSDLLHDRALFGDCLHRTRVPGLSVMPAGNWAHATTTGLASDRLPPLLDQLRSEFELVVFDLPPVDELRGSASLTSAIDGVVLVVEANRTRRADVERANRQLAAWQSRLLGVVINKQRGS